MIEVRRGQYSPVISDFRISHPRRRTTSGMTGLTRMTGDAVMRSLWLFPAVLQEQNRSFKSLHNTEPFPFHVTMNVRILGVRLGGCFEVGNAVSKEGGPCFLLMVLHSHAQEIVESLS